MTRTGTNIPLDKKTRIPRRSQPAADTDGSFYPSEAMSFSSLALALSFSGHSVGVRSGHGVRPQGTKSHYRSAPQRGERKLYAVRRPEPADSGLGAKAYKQGWSIEFITLRTIVRGIEVAVFLGKTDHDSSSLPYFVAWS